MAELPLCEDLENETLAAAWPAGTCHFCPEDRYLFSFDEPVASPKPAAAQDPFGSFETPAPQAAQGQGQGGFGDFGDSSGFGANFNGAQAAPPVDKKNDIMSMFNTQPQGQMGMGGSKSVAAARQRRVCSSSSSSSRRRYARCRQWSALPQSWRCRNTRCALPPNHPPSQPSTAAKAPTITSGDPLALSNLLTFLDENILQ